MIGEKQEIGNQGGNMMFRVIVSFFAIAILILSSVFSKVEIYNDINEYINYIGSEAKEEFKNKWNMDESIFPRIITEDMHVEDYKMVYYNPWDAQYLSYLVVEYDEESYQMEKDRLKNYASTDYIGYYGVTGFSKYTLLAIYADSYNGFVYAITDNESKIVYVELIFCNYFFDLKYKDYINNDYLPDGFDATENNAYRKKMI